MRIVLGIVLKTPNVLISNSKNALVIKRVVSIYLLDCQIVSVYNYIIILKLHMIKFREREKTAHTIYVLNIVQNSLAIIEKSQVPN